MIVHKENKNLLFDKKHKVNIKYLVKRTMLPFLKLFYSVLFLFLKKDERTLKYKLSICCIFKDESRYLKEWIEYHLMLGVDHFYLYNNNSTDDYKNVLYKYIESGVVTLTDWPDVPGQVSAYKHWYQTFRQETNWCIFMDIDEFCCPRKHTNMQEWLKKYSKYPVVIMYWQFFGTSGIMEENDGLVIEQFTSCFRKIFDIGKPIYNTRYDINSFDTNMVHNIITQWGWVKLPPINVEKRFIIWNFHKLSTRTPDM